MNYGIYFDSSTSVDALRETLRARYGVTPDLVYAGPIDRLNAYPGPDPLVLITPTDGEFGQELSAGDRFHDVTRAGELDLAVVLCKAAGTRALVDDGTLAPDYWILVTRDGSYGRVLTDSDGAGLTVVHACEPITGEPQLPVVSPPDWASGG